MEDAERDIAKMAYENSHTWIRHYDTILAGLNFFVASIVLGYVGVKLQSGAASDYFMDLDLVEAVEAFFPLALIVMVFIFTVLIDHEIQRTFRSIIRIELALGFYNPMKILNDEPLLEVRLLKSGSRSSDTCRAFYALHVVLLSAVLALVSDVLRIQGCYALPVWSEASWRSGRLAPARRQPRFSW